MENSYIGDSSFSSQASTGRFMRRALSDSMNRINSKSHSPTSNKTPSRRVSAHKGSSAKKTTPGRSTSTTPGKLPQDRFIPNRQTSNFELGYYRHCVEAELPSDPKEREQVEVRREMLTGISRDAKILSFNNKPDAPEGHKNRSQVLFSACKNPSASAAKSRRHIPKVPERILDAPGIVDDYYLNLLSWSSCNMVAMALGSSLYTWDACGGAAALLTTLDGPADSLCSVSWNNDGHVLALGTVDGTVQLWDVARQQRLRVMSGHRGRVPCLSWHQHLLSSGASSGAVHSHDVRIARHHVGTLTAHTQEVCGLTWSPDGRYLASGGNDNMLHVWPQSSACTTSSAPLHAFSQHQAAVKALAWCPWQPSTLASGGGTADRHIRIWSVTSGTALNAVDTDSQVCGIRWCPHYRELISGHGFAQNQLIIWKYPSMEKVSELTGHTARILFMDISPDRQFVMSASADETLRLWNCFQTDPKQLKKDTEVGPAAIHSLNYAR